MWVFPAHKLGLLGFRRARKCADFKIELQRQRPIDKMASKETKKGELTLDLFSLAMVALMGRVEDSSFRFHVRKCLKLNLSFASSFSMTFNRDLRHQCQNAC